MKKFYKLTYICVLVAIILILTSCNSKFQANIELNTSQESAYNQVENYVDENNVYTDDTDALLYEIKIDISNTNNANLENEIKIAKLKIDKLILKQKKMQDIQIKNQNAQVDKKTYMELRDSISNKYPYSDDKYYADKSYYERLISYAYSDYYAECQKINSSSMGDGYKSAYRHNAYQKCMQLVSDYNEKLSNLKEQWKNKKDYEAYNNLYNQVDSQLKTDISIIENEYLQDLKKIDIQLDKLIKQR